MPHSNAFKQSNTHGDDSHHEMALSLYSQSPYIVIVNKDCDFGNQTPHLMLLMKRVRPKALIMIVNVTYLAPRPFNSFLI